jgi:nitrogen fixation protein FixH
MNWGKGIIIGMGLFIGFILTLVVIMMRQNIDLVTEDYYQKEIAFNQEYNADVAYASANDSIQIAYTDNFVSIQLGKSFQSDSIRILLRRPNNQKQDMEFKLAAQPTINIPAKHLPKGVFECIVEGKINGESYRYEQDLNIK